MDQQQTDEPQYLDELEEGEIAEDSNDGCSVTNDDNDNDCANAFDDAVNGASTNRVGQAPIVGGFDDEAGGGQKRRKKVVRKVKRKIKVKKKVVRKKGGGGGGGGMGPNANDLGANNVASGATNTTTNLLPLTNSHNIQSSVVAGLNLNQQSLLQSNTATVASTNTTTPLLPHLAQQSHETMNLLHKQSNTNLLNQNNNSSYQQPQQQQSSYMTTPLLPQNQTQQPNQNNPQQLDSLWEQQILMLQELQKQQQQTDQKHTQILRAAATDEDLRIFPPMLVRPVQPSAQPLQTLLPMNATTSLNSTSSTGQTLQLQHNPLYTTAPPAPVNSNFNYQQNQTNNLNTPNSNLVHHQTPSSPDDENGKSSYEAISKMLTLLRNSANVSDPSENADDELQTNNDELSLSLSSLNTSTNEQKLSATKRESIEYVLIPILVEGIDYTKYKLLSQYEPKFKNDPRLNQQS